MPRFRHHHRLTKADGLLGAGNTLFGDEAGERREELQLSPLSGYGAARVLLQLVLKVPHTRLLCAATRTTARRRSPGSGSRCSRWRSSLL